MINIEEVLWLVNSEMGYGTDSYSLNVFKTLDKKDEKKYLVPAKAIKRYIRSYIERKFKERNNKPPVTYEDFDSIIKIVGDGKGRKYEKDGILRMLEDERINELITGRLYEKAYLFENGNGKRMIVPNFVWEYYNEETNMKFEDIEQAQHYVDIKDDTTNTLKMKLHIIQQEIENRKKFENMIENTIQRQTDA